jgi:radical SAM protein with 4Fe4S-binding SPASM domain
MSMLPGEYGMLVRELQKKAAACRQPLHGAFELTARCNLFCRMCYISNAPGDPRQIEQELSATSWLEIARQAKAKGTLFLLLTGGEILLRQDFFDLYTPLTKMGFVLSLFTNGTLISEDIAAKIAEAPPHRMEITLYGASAATYESITGVPGSFERCCRGIESLLKRGVKFGLKTTLTRQNIGEFEGMKRMAAAWNLPFSGGWQLTRRTDGSASGVDGCRLPVSEGIDLESGDTTTAENWRQAAGQPQNGKENLNSFYCQAGKTAFTVDSSGGMHVCSDLPAPGARPLETGFTEAWTALRRYVDAAPPLSSECSSCEALAYCGICPAWSLTETGTMTSPVPYICDIAFERKKRYEHT